MVNTQQLHRAKHRLITTLSGGRARQWLLHAGWLLSGFALSAGALNRSFQPLALGLLCAAPPGWPALLIALGGAVGYPVFWGSPGLQGTVWMALGLVCALALGDRPIIRRQKLLIPSLAALIVSGTGVLLLFRFGVDTPVGVYLLRVAVSAAASLTFSLWRQNPSGWPGLGVRFLAVLALAQIWPGRYVGLGFAAAAFFCAGGSLPSAMVAGLALDLARVTNVKMTAVLCAAWCLGRLPRTPRWFPMLSAAVSFVPVAVLSGVWNVRPLPGLILGGALAGLLPELLREPKPSRPRGEAAVAQVRLEQMAMALHQMEQTLLLTVQPEPDTQAILEKSCAAACDACPERRGCKARAKIPVLSPGVLEQPGLGEEDLPAGCRKTARLLMELRRGQETLRRIKGDGCRQRAFRAAVQEQYGFLAAFLEGLSDDLAQRHEHREPRFRPEIGLSSRSCGEENGDKCLWFEGVGNRYYVLLCDGMGTGAGAARESAEAASLLRQMLTAGFPPEYALRSLNTLAVLRELGGCTTVDLVQLRLDTGKGVLYKWGASPSYLMVSGQLRKIGTAGPPPGLSNSSREMVDRLSLGRGELLILLSDGVSEEGLLDSARTTPSQPPGEMAAAILEKECSGGDDATAVVIRLVPGRLGTG